MCRYTPGFKVGTAKLKGEPEARKTYMRKFNTVIGEQPPTTPGFMRTLFKRIGTRNKAGTSRVSRDNSKRSLPEIP